MYNRDEDMDELRITTLIIYGLYAAAFLTFGVTLLVGGVLAFVKREEASGTPYDVHMEYLFRTLIGAVAGVVVAFVVSWLLNAISFLHPFTFLAWGVLLLVGVWYGYRVATGLYRLWRGQPVSPHGWL